MTLSRFFMYCVIPLSALPACSKGGTDSGAPAQGWWTINGDDVSSGEGYAAGEDGDEDGDDEAFLWGELRRDGGTYEGEGGVVVVEDGQAGCMVEFTLQQTGDAGGCESCSLQMTVTVGDVATEATALCGDVGVEPGSFEDTELAIGVEGETLWMEQDGEWEPVGETWDENGELGFEVWFE